MRHFLFLLAAFACLLASLALAVGLAENGFPRLAFPVGVVNMAVMLRAFIALFYGRA